MKRICLAALAGCMALAGCSAQEKTVRVDDGTGVDGVVKRDIDAARNVASRQSDFQRDGEKVLSGER